MKRSFVLTLALASVCGLWNPINAAAQQHKLVFAKDGSGVFGYKDTPVQPWSGFHVHDPDRPAPRKVTPPPSSGESPLVAVPSDAVVLFSGQDLAQWQASTWRIDKGELVATDGPLVSKEEFGDCQLHLEWMAPVEQTENVMNRGNNGVFLLNAIEVQIFDSYTTKIYPDGQAAAIYAQTPPLVNACREPGQWQSYDILFSAPKYQGDKLAAPARLTMLHNGVLVHLHQEIYGTTPHSKLAEYPKQPLMKGPLSLGGHHCPVRFRNIWMRRI